MTSKAILLCLRMALWQEQSAKEKQRWSLAFVDAWRESQPIYDVHRYHEERPGQLHDADGNPIYYVVWANLQTGHVKRLRSTSGAIPSTSRPTDFIRDEDGNAIEFEEFYPAPLYFVENEE